MNDKEKLLKKIDDLADALEEQLPTDADDIHRQEILDIVSLVRQRTEMFLREYGILPCE